MTVPRASASNARQWPSGDGIPSSWYTYPTVAGIRIRQPPATARSDSPARRLWMARCTATADVEHAVFTLSAGPLSPSLYATRVMAYSRSVANSSG
jgi:hypothetical protein